MMRPDAALCQKCKGTGTVPKGQSGLTTICPVCHGKGHV